MKYSLCRARKVDDDCLQELRSIYDRRDLAEARRDLAAWLGRWQAKYPKLTGWAEEHIEETLTFYRLPRQHHKHEKHRTCWSGEREDQAAHPRRSDFPQRGELLAPGATLAVEAHETGWSSTDT